MVENPVVSIVVPVYKAADYLTQCVDSILRQSFINFELLLVDDGSPDNCPAMCDEYGKKDSRVQVIHKENGGVSSARNLGIEQAVGQYIVFVDSDDYVDVDYLSNMLNATHEVYKDEKRELVISDYQVFSENGLEERNYPTTFCAELVPGGITTEQFRALVFEFRIFPPYCKLYRRDVIEEKQLRFNTQLKSAEDFDFNSRYMEMVDRVCYISDTQYHYRIGYKKYVPSNHGVLGQSEIKSVHIMAHGITDLAKRVGLYTGLENEICLWAAKKQYFNRLPMLFARSKEVSIIERYRLYRQLLGDDVYRSAFKRGVRSTMKSATRLIGSNFDCFLCWWIFYKLNEL